VDYYVTFDSIAVGAPRRSTWSTKPTGTGNPLYLYAGAASDNNAFLFFEGAWNVLQPKIADGTFVIKNSSEAVALQDKATDPRRNGQDHRPGHHQLGLQHRQEPGRSQPDRATAEDKGDVFILAPNDGTARAIADAFAADTDVTSYLSPVRTPRRLPSSTSSMASSP
jgi:putative multiple sugar transport system substrate-binding protein